MPSLSGQHPGRHRAKCRYVMGRSVASSATVDGGWGIPPIVLSPPAVARPSLLAPDADLNEINHASPSSPGARDPTVAPSSGPQKSSRAASIGVDGCIMLPSFPGHAARQPNHILPAISHPTRICCFSSEARRGRAAQAERKSNACTVLAWRMRVLNFSRP
ncbi:hypothetical protein G7046_g7614 [Stylonectria norvegica]|nr:hypothetical protein G7046_g7614 [Stylonectria norvegica]